MGLGPLIPGNPYSAPPSQSGLGGLLSGLFGGVQNFGNTVTQAVQQASNFVNNVGSNIVSNFTAPSVGMAPYQQSQPQGSFGSGNQLVTSAYGTQSYSQQYMPSGGQPVTVNTTVQAPQVTVDLGQGIGQFIGQALSGFSNNIAPALAPLVSQFSTIANNLASVVGQQQNSVSAQQSDVISRAVANIQASQSAEQDRISSLRNQLNDDIAQGLGVQKASIDNIVQKVNALEQNTTISHSAIMDQLAADLDKNFASLQSIVSAVPDKLPADLQAKQLSLFGLLIEFIQTLEADLKSLPGITPLVTQKVFDTVFAPIRDSIIGQKGKLDQLVANLQDGKYKDMAEFRAAFIALVPAASLLFGAVNLASILALIIESVQVGASPAVNALQQQINAEHPTALLPPNELMEALRRETWTRKDVESELAKAGYNQDRRGIIMDNALRLVDQNTLEESTLRGFIPPEESAARLSQSGYSPEAIKIIQDLYDKIPNPSDLTRIADKRVWGQHIDPKYGQFSEIPDEYRLYMAQWGLDEKFTNWLWAAHWNLPSPQQIFEMFHRGKISQADMEAYLALTDWLPYFRDKLLSISYNVLGRIDTRRAHNAGIIDDATAIQKYQDAGYTLEDARILLSLAKATNTTDGMAQITKLKARAQTAVENAYVKGKINRDQAIARLTDLGMTAGVAAAITQVLDEEIFGSLSVPKVQDHKAKAATKVLAAFGNGSIPASSAHEFLLELGYSEIDAANELALIEIDRQSNLKKLWVDHAESLYVQHQIDLPDLEAMLKSQGFSDSEIGSIEEELTLKRQLRNKKLTEPQIMALHKKGIITDDELFAELVGFGYPDREIGWILKSVGIGG